MLRSDNISSKMLIVKIDSVQSLSNYEKNEWKRVVPVLDVLERNQLFHYFDGLTDRELKFEIRVISKNKLIDQYDEICEDVTRKFTAEVKEKEQKYQNSIIK
jgi:hypothetical protein